MTKEKIGDYCLDRYDFLNSNFSEFAGTQWYKACKTLFQTLRLHLAKIRLFREISEDYVNNHWIKTEIINYITDMIDFKKSNWTVDKQLLLSQAKLWLDSFENSSVLVRLMKDNYKPYIKAFMTLHNLKKEKEILKFIEADSKLCDDTFISIITTLAEALSNKKLNTKKSTSADFMYYIRYNIINTVQVKLGV